MKVEDTPRCSEEDLTVTTTTLKHRSWLLPLLVSAAWLGGAAVPLASDAQLPEERLAELEGLVGSGRCAQALADLEPLREQHPHDPDLMVLEANCRVRQAESSERVFDQMAFERLRIGLGQARMTQEMNKRFYRVQRVFNEQAVRDALGLFRRAIETAPHRADLVIGTAAVLVHTGRVDEALELIAAHREGLSENEVSEIVQIVQDRINERQFETAERLVEGLAEQFPEHEGPYVARASMALARHRALDAIEQLETARRLAPYNDAVAFELNRLRLLAGQLDEAVADLVPLTPRSTVFEVWLALARSVKTPGSAARLWTKLAEGLDQASELDQTTKRLILHYKRLLAGEGQPTPTMRLRGSQLLAERGLPLPAVIECRAAVSGDPQLLEGWVEMSRILRRNTLFDLAAGALDRGIELAQRLPEASRPYGVAELRGWRAEVLLGLGDLDGTRKACQELADGSEARPYVRALASLGLGRKREAKRLLRGVVEAGGDHAEAAKARLTELEAERDD
jgi:tetratricopeptide (TPR) repeat protein